MQNNERNLTDAIDAPKSNHEDSASEAQLSTKTRDRLERLAQWRLDPALITFPERDLKVEGGYAIVSRALLTLSPDDAREEALKSLKGKLMYNARMANLEGGKRLQEAQLGYQPAKHKANGGDGQEVEPGAETSAPQKAVAVKKMKTKTQDDVERVLGLTLREAEFFVKLSHTHIIKLEGFVEDVPKEMIWLVFPWQANGTLKDFVASQNWEIPERISLIGDVARGLNFLHTREPPICHGDLKSINILVDYICRAMLTDFGSAHHPVAKSPNKERDGTIIQESRPAPPIEATLCHATKTITLTGIPFTIRWAAPEVLEREEFSLASDVWALGWVAYEVMTNSIPFQGVKGSTAILRVVRGDLPSISDDTRMLLMQELCSIVGRCWNMDPTKRPTAWDCLKAINVMPLIRPNPVRTEDAENTRFVGLINNLGDMHQRQSDYVNASKYYARALELYTDMANNHGKTWALLSMARIHKYRREYNQAVACYSKALKFNTATGYNSTKAGALCGLADIHLLRNEYNQAVTLYCKSLDILVTLGNTSQQAGPLWGLAEIHRLKNEYSQAASFYSDCLRIHTDRGNEQRRASALWGLAEVHLSQHEYNQAVMLYSECLKIRTDGGDKAGRAAALCGLAEIYRRRSEHKEAVTLYSECLEIWNAIGDRQGRVYGLERLAWVYRVQSEYNPATEYFSEALKLSTDLSDGRSRASALLGLADVHRLQNRYTQAIMLYSECLQIWTDLGYRSGRAEALLGLADVHRRQKEFSQTRTHVSESLKLFADIGNKSGRANALWCLAEMHRAQVEYSQSATFYSECLQIWTDIGSRFERAFALCGLADVHRWRKEYSQAMASFSEALKLSTDFGSRYGRALTLQGMADAHRDQDDHSNAMSCYQEAAEIYKAIGHPDDEATALKRLADVRRLMEPRTA